MEVLSHVAGFPGIPPLAEKFVPVERVRELYRRVQRSPGGFGFGNLLAAMRVELRVDSANIARVPTSGPVVVVANHPFGLLDGAVLASLLTRVRPDVKVITNYPLRDVPELGRHCIFVDPFQSDPPVRATSVDTNRRALREALGVATQRWNAGHVSRGRGFAMAISSGSDHRSGVERYSRASDSPHRSCSTSHLFSADATV